MFTFDAVAAGVLFAAFFVEFGLILRHNPEQRLIQDMKANFLIGVCLVGVGLVIKGVEFGLFSLFYRVALFRPEPSWQLWVVGVLSCDFVHYFYHWVGHKTRLFWAAHVTHHSSEHFNLSTGWRTNFFHLFYRFLFWAPLCLLGIPPEMILFIESLTAIQNFLVHTEKVGKLGVLDWMFNTPSNHRVHHASNPEYLDKNLGGIFMLYDHALGTYAKETTPPIYGITHNIHSHNPSEIITHEYVRLLQEFPKIKGVMPKIRYLLSPPQ
jgi:sterol desaturase/sphingolipid hydroxylase (fatty acid hydroxylase superfamily)